MANARKSSRMAPLQEITLTPITDPDEQAALDERLGQTKNTGAPVRTRGSINTRRTVTASQVLELWRQLPLQKKFLVLTQLADNLSPDQQLALVQRFQRRLAR
jgi:hypothetical protein